MLRNSDVIERNVVCWTELNCDWQNCLHALCLSCCYARMLGPIWPTNENEQFHGRWRKSYKMLACATISTAGNKLLISSVDVSFYRGQCVCLAVGSCVHHSPAFLPENGTDRQSHLQLGILSSNLKFAIRPSLLDIWACKLKRDGRMAPVHNTAWREGCIKQVRQQVRLLGFRNGRFSKVNAVVVPKLL